MWSAAAIRRDVEGGSGSGGGARGSSSLGTRLWRCWHTIIWPGLGGTLWVQSSCRDSTFHKALHFRAWSCCGIVDPLPPYITLRSAHKLIFKLGAACGNANLELWNRSLRCLSNVCTHEFASRGLQISKVSGAGGHLEEGVYILVHGEVSHRLVQMVVRIQHQVPLEDGQCLQGISRSSTASGLRSG